LRSQLGDDYFRTEERKQQLVLQNIKDDVILIQFKLVRKDNKRTHNVQTFVNIPTSKQLDINIATLIEIVGKQNLMANNKKKTSVQFLPYNRSILTRVLHRQLRCNNVLVINHFPKQSILKHLTATQTTTGPARGLFNQLIKLGYNDGDMSRITKLKVTNQQALKILQKHFREDLWHIYDEISQFRDGMKSLEVYLEQTKTMLGS
jgi:hypothetical protein